MRLIFSAFDRQQRRVRGFALSERMLAQILPVHAWMQKAYVYVTVVHMHSILANCAVVVAYVNLTRTVFVPCCARGELGHEVIQLDRGSPAPARHVGPVHGGGVARIQGFAHQTLISSHNMQRECTVYYNKYTAAYAT